MAVIARYSVFFSPITWIKIHWCFIHTHFKDLKAVWIISGDETIVTKSGKLTFGLGRFFSSLYSKAVPGLSIFTISLINVSTRTSHPVYAKQQLPAAKETSSNSSKKSSSTTTLSKRKPGRPKGSKNKNKAEVELSPHLIFIQTMLLSVLRMICGLIDLRYFVLDGAFGFNAAAQMVKQADLELISKLQKNSKLYFPYEGTYAGRGPRRKYGQQIDYDQINKQYLRETAIEDDIKTNIYQMMMWHKLFPQMLNIVVIHKTNIKTGVTAHIVLFSTDSNLAYDKIIDYYRLRFQIEFNFREAKQYWGLEDFMNVKQIPVNNAINLAFFMVNLSKAWINKYQQHNPLFSVEDLKAHFRGQKYVEEIIKLLPQKPEPILFSAILDQIGRLGCIHHTHSTLSSP